MLCYNDSHKMPASFNQHNLYRCRCRLAVFIILTDFFNAMQLYSKTRSLILSNSIVVLYTLTCYCHMI